MKILSIAETLDDCMTNGLQSKEDFDSLVLLNAKPSASTEGLARKPMDSLNESARLTNDNLSLADTPNSYNKNYGENVKKNSFQTSESVKDCESNRLKSKEDFDNISLLNKTPSVSTEGKTDMVNPQKRNSNVGFILADSPNLCKQKGDPMSEKLSFQDETSRIYFSTIPNIIFELGWSPYKISAYCVIKRVAGESGVCTKSYENLAKQAGMSRRNFIDIVNEFCQEDKILKKPLIKIYKRKSQFGDSDTNIIKVVDIWPENINKFSKNENDEDIHYDSLDTENLNREGGSAQYAPPSAQYAPGVVHNMHQGGAQYAPKEEPIKKNNLRTTAATPTPSKGMAAAAAHKENKKIEKEPRTLEHIAEQNAAKSLKQWVDNEAHKPRKRKMGCYYEDVVWGNDWIIPLKVYEDLIHKYGIEYFKAHLEHMIIKQKDFDSGKLKKDQDVKTPERFLRKSCSVNYAESNERKA